METSKEALYSFFRFFKLVRFCDFRLQNLFEGCCYHKKGGVDKFKLTPETEELLRGISSALQDAPASSSSQSTCCIALKPFFRLLFSCTLITGYLPKNSKIKDLKCILLFVILVLESKEKKNRFKSEIEFSIKTFEMFLYQILYQIFRPHSPYYQRTIGPPRRSCWSNDYLVRRQKEQLYPLVTTSLKSFWMSIS